MRKTTGYTASDALDWMNDHDRGKVLFRGQTRVWPTVKPSIARCDLDEDTRDRMWTICHRFNERAHGLTGYRIPSAHDRLCILQHYIRRSPLVDLTGTSQVALYFALKGASPGQECVVYSVDQSRAETDDVLVCDHSFLALPPDEGGLRSRWVTQDGYTVGPKFWFVPERVRNFDMLELDGVTCMRFLNRTGDAELLAGFGDLESTDEDLLVGKVRWIVDDIVQEYNLSTDAVQDILRRSNTYNPDSDLSTRIDELTDLALGCDSRLVKELQCLKAAHDAGVWDTSFLASLLYVEKKLQNQLGCPYDSKRPH